jgi:hypothetical protein
MVTKRYGLVYGILVIAALLLLVSPAAAEICYGKLCTTSPLKDSGLCTICCGGHGTCIAFNNCKCDDGWGGQECDIATTCGSCTNWSVVYGCSPPDGRIPQRTGLNPNIAGVCMDRFSNSTDVGKSRGTCSCPEGRTGVCCGEYTRGTLSPSALDFGTVNTASTAAAQAPLTYTSPLYSSNMTVLNITLEGANSGDFALGSGTCAENTNVTGGGNCTITVSFTPVTTGTRNARLNVTTREPDGNNTQFIYSTFTGTGVTTVSRILVDPTTPATVFAGLDGAGIFRSTNSGGLWSSMTLAPATMRIKDLVIKPGDSTQLYAATYSGVYRSTDSGTSWAACANTGLTNLNVLSLAISPAGTLYAGTGDGVFTSTDNCASWTALNNGLP